MPFFFAHAAKTAPAPQIPPQIILTWSAENFYPSNYRGRALPTIGTPITVSTEMLINGKSADLSQANIAWYNSGNQIDSGIGLKQTSLKPDTNDVDGIFVRAEITLGNIIAEQSILIPISQPVVAIEIPYPHSIINANSDVTMRAVPYFFNVASLNRFIFYWQVGSIKKNMGAENSISLKISSPFSEAQKNVAVSSYVQSRDDMTNIIKTDTNIFIR
ncbi:MAG: hypothetical protein AAB920_00950 [Patescibacteria group bacterium]